MIDIASLASGPAYLAVGAAIIANLFPGIPEEIFLLGLGYLAGRSTFEFISLTIFLIIGFLLIDTLIYILARRGNKIVLFIGRKLLGDWFTDDGSFIQRRLAHIIFISRFVPVLRFMGPFLGGAYRYPYRFFIAVDAIALSIYVPALLGLGVYFEDRISQIISGVGVVKNSILMFVVLVLVFVIFRQVRKYMRNRYNQNNTQNRVVMGITWLRDKLK